MVDDMGWNDVSFHGSDQILTPNIDSLAYHGVILHQYYSEAVCTPARTALLTGKYPMRLGMHGMPLFNSEDRGIPLTERLLPSYLRELGYATHLVGKWHVGMSRPAYLPTARGYDTHYGMRGGYIDYYTYNKVEQWPNGRVLFGLDLYDGAEPQDRETRYIVDALTDNAIKVISRHNTSRPLFLHVTHNAPHAGNDGAALQPPLAAAGVKNPHIANSNRRLYADVVTQIDRSVGRIVRALADRDLLDDTIIVFASDNGAPTVGSLRNWGVNLPLRGKKNTPWEGGVRVPAFIWHAGLRPRVWSGLMHVTDWLPTLTAAAGGSISRPIDGVNQWDSIVQDGLSKRTEVLLSVEDSARNMYAAYRAGDYKVIVGNVTGLSNGYYGAELLAERRAPPEYFPSLRSCAVARAFEEMGRYLQTGAVTAARRAATVTPADSPDPTACLPTPNRGCLFNVRRDPTETRDLWARAPKIAALLTARLRGLWAQQARRGPPALRNESDPALYGYNWRPWITDTPQSASPPRFETLDLSVRLATNRTSTRAVPVDCSATTGIRNFLCILKSVF